MTYLLALGFAVSTDPRSTTIYLDLCLQCACCLASVMLISSGATRNT